MNETTRRSLTFMRDYWVRTESPFSEEQIGAIDGLLAEPPSFSDEEWEQFFDRLAGPEGCDFKEEPDFTWHCSGGNDKPITKAILEDMLDDEGERDRVLALVDVFGGHCDCEVILNAQDRILKGGDE